MASWTSPTSRATRTAAATLSSAATSARALNVAMEVAFVGPLISCFEESNNAPMAVMTMAVYSPYSGGRPASAA